MIITTSNLKPYSAYKDSGVEWLGKIPAHWEVKRLKYAAPLRTGKLDVKPVDTTYIGLENIESWTGRLLIQDQPENVESVVSSFESGDVLFGKLRPYLAKVVRPKFSGVSTGEILALYPMKYSQSYLYYSLLNKVYIQWIDMLTYGTKMPRVSPDQVSNSFAPLPPLPEQTAIAAFLDRETAKIDALVSKKERLIKLLREKRTALISHAVTKGLDPDASLKDSGVEWLGEIPAHWEVKRLKYAAPLRTGKLDVKPVDTTYIGLENIESWTGRLLIQDQPENVESVVSSFESGDVLFGKLRPYLAKVVRPKFSGVSTGEILALYPMKYSQSYLYYSLLNKVYIQWIDMLTYGTKMPRVSPDQVSNSFAPLPPLPEQTAIAAFLDRETAKIDALVAKVQEAIDRLKEYRIALISAAVTGKIDVREVA